MKQNKGSSRKRPAKTAAAGRKTTHRRRPLHKRILLHPFSVMVLLCAGVLIVGSTFHGAAESYDVTAQVQAVPPSSPAIITSPQDQEHFSTEPITVDGTCPPASYVKLYRGGNFSGVDLCSGTAFHIQTSLTPGANTLEAKVFNLTDNAGPASAPVTVYYDVTSVSPPPSTTASTQLQVANVEKGQYQDGQVQQTSVNPTISGVAPPYATIVVTFHSDVTTCATKADGLGWWSCTLAHDLPPGVHHVDVVATTIDGQVLSFPGFQIRVMANIPNLIKTATKPFLIQSEYLYQAHKPGQSFSFSLGVGGGKAPFDVLIDWGDHQTTKVVRGDQSVFVVTHIYEDAADYPVVITMTDANGTTSSMQLLAVVKAISAPVASVTRPPGGFAQFLRDVRRYLWVVWPVYAAVVLMVLSYWIGEQEAYKRLIARRTTSGSGKGRR